MTDMERLSSAEILQILTEIPEGYKHPGDDFFQNCNAQKPEFHKLGVTNPERETTLESGDSVLCTAPGCQQTFQTVSEYNSHYNSLHKYLCSMCKKNMPTAHLLDLHISENHDSFFAAQAERQPMYACYLAECTHKSSSSADRKDHCLREHKFPANFKFETSKKHDAKVMASGDFGSSTSMDVDADSKTEHRSQTKNNYFSFGHGRVKTFKSAGAKKGTNIKSRVLDDDQTMTKDLLESLPTVNQSN